MLFFIFNSNIIYHYKKCKKLNHYFYRMNDPFFQIKIFILKKKDKQNN